MKRILSFRNKRVLDIGCNTGGMLLHIPEIAHGVGLDYDEACIKSAIGMRDTFQFANRLEFHCVDLNREDLHFKTEFDIGFLLSVGSWVKNWRGLYKKVFDACRVIYLETNNDTEGADQLEFFKDLGVKIHLVIKESLDDSTGNKGRKTYVLYRPEDAAILQIWGGEISSQKDSKNQENDSKL